MVESRYQGLRDALLYEDIVYETGNLELLLEIGTKHTGIAIICSRLSK